MLNGKLALVTGGGSGIGLGIVTKLLDAGAEVMIVQRREPPAQLLERAGVSSIRADLANVHDLQSVVDRAVTELGGLDILVNNAGIMFERSVAEIAVEEWDRMMSLNLRTPMFLVQAALPHLRRRGGGSIVNIGSVEGLGTNSHHAAYAASKSGLHGLTRALAIDLGEFGIRVNSIAPGWIESDLSAQYVATMSDPAGVRHRLNGLHPVGRTGEPGDIGDAAVFLASGHSSFITGETLVVDGGRTVRLSHPDS